MKRPIPLTTSSILAAIVAAVATMTLVLVASSNSAVAASSLNNGNFETGDLTGWRVDTTASGGTAGAATGRYWCSNYSECWMNGYWLAQEGTYFAQLTPGNLSEYTKISQPFTASKGDKISGWAIWQPENYGDESYASKGEVVITSDSGQTVATPFQGSYCCSNWPGPVPPSWTYWEHTFTEDTGAGKFKIEARVQNTGGSGSPYDGDSVLGLDEVKTSTGVPDTTDPDTTIGSTKPADPTNNTSASFSFSSSESNSTFQCKLDNGTYESCSSTKQYTGLAQGSHTFSVKAIDQAGNEDETPAGYTWTVDTTAPVAQAPTQTLTSGATLGISTVPVKLGWSATDDSTSAIARYELQQSVDGGPWSGVTLSSVTQTNITRQLTPAKTYAFQIRARDGAGNWSAWKPGPTFKVNLFQEANGAISYTGTWSAESLTSASGGGVKYASTPGDPARTAKLTQTHIRNMGWVSTKGPNRGKAEVRVDGVKVSTPDLYASSSQYRKVVYVRNQLDPAVSHSLESRPLGTKNASSSGTRVDMDALVVLSSP